MSTSADKTKTEPFDVTGSQGAPLAGVIHHPEGPARGSVVLAHCFTCSKDLHTLTRLVRGLAESGYAAVRFDFTGIGESGGDFASKTVSHNVRDLGLVAMALIQRGMGPCALVGHSLGGAATLLVAQRLKAVRSVAVIGAPSAPVHIRHLLREDEVRIRDRGVATVTVAGRPFPISTEFLRDLEDHDQENGVAHLGRPLLVVHAVDDDVVAVSEGERIFRSARQPKAFVPLLNTDHLITAPEAARQLLRILLDWLDRTL